MRIAFLFVFFMHIASVQAAIVYPAHASVTYTPENTVIFFDVDGVLVDRGFWQNIGEYWNIFWESCHKWDIVKLSFWMIANFSAIVEKVHRGQSNDLFFDTLAQQWPFLYEKTSSGVTILGQLKEAVSRGTPRAEIQILIELHELGYTIGIGTNQGKRTFERLMQTKTVPDASHYILIYTPDYRSTLYQYEKPDREYFLDIQKILNKKGLSDKYCMFIDDKLENVQAATQVGMIGIHVDNNKTNPARQLYKDLETLGIVKQHITILNN